MPRRPETRPERVDPPLEFALMYLQGNTDFGTRVVQGTRVRENFPLSTGTVRTLRPLLSRLYARSGNQILTPTAIVDESHATIINDHATTPGATIASGTVLTTAGLLGGPGVFGPEPETNTTADFDMPASGETAEVSVVDTGWMIAGERIRLKYGDTILFGVIDSIVDETTFAFENDGTSGNPAAGETIYRGTSLAWWSTVAVSAALPSNGANPLLAYSTLSVSSTAWMSPGDMLLLKEEIEPFGSPRLLLYLEVGEITDATHVKVRRQNAPPFETSYFGSRPIPAGASLTPARLLGRNSRADENPFTMLIAGFGVPAVSATVTLRVLTTRWMTPGMGLVCANSGNSGTFFGIVDSIVDSTHVVVTNAGGEASWLFGGNPAAGTRISWGCLVAPYTKITATFTWPAYDAVAPLAVESTAWIVPQAPPSYEPVWIGHPTSSGWRPAVRINGRWYALVKPAIDTPALIRARGSDGLRIWRFTWGPTIPGATGTGIKSVTSDGEKIFAGGARASNALVADAFSVRAHDGDGHPLWQTDTGGQVLQVLLVPGTGLICVHTKNAGDKTVTCLDPDDGSILWQSTPFAGCTHAYSVTAFNSKLVVAHASQSTTTQLRWPSPPSGNVTVYSPAARYFELDGTPGALFNDAAGTSAFRSVAGVGDRLMIDVALMAKPIVHPAFAPLYWSELPPNVNQYSDSSQDPVVPVQSGSGVPFTSPWVYTYPWTIRAPLTPDPDGVHFWAGGKQFNATSHSQDRTLSGATGEVAFLPDGGVVFANGRRFSSSFVSQWLLPEAVNTVCAFGDDVIFGRGT